MRGQRTGCAAGRAIRTQKGRRQLPGTCSSGMVRPGSADHQLRAYALCFSFSVSISTPMAARASFAIW